MGAVPHSRRKGAVLLCPREHPGHRPKRRIFVRQDIDRSESSIDAEDFVAATRHR